MECDDCLADRRTVKRGYRVFRLLVAAKPFRIDAKRLRLVFRAYLVLFSFPLPKTFCKWFGSNSRSSNRYLSVTRIE